MLKCAEIENTVETFFEDVDYDNISFSRTIENSSDLNDVNSICLDKFVNDIRSAHMIGKTNVSEITISKVNLL